MILHRKTFDGTANATTTIDLLTLDGSLGLHQYLCDYNIEVSGNSATVAVTGKGSFADSAFRDIAGSPIAIGGGHTSASKYALSALNFTTTGGAYKIMITRQIESV